MRQAGVFTGLPLSLDGFSCVRYGQNQSGPTIMQPRVRQP